MSPKSLQNHHNTPQFFDPRGWTKPSDNHTSLHQPGPFKHVCLTHNSHNPLEQVSTMGEGWGRHKVQTLPWPAGNPLHPEGDQPAGDTVFLFLWLHQTQTGGATVIDPSTGSHTETLLWLIFSKQSSLIVFPVLYQVHDPSLLCRSEDLTKPPDLYSRGKVCSMGRGLINISLRPMLTGNSSLMGNNKRLRSTTTSAKKKHHTSGCPVITWLPSRAQWRRLRIIFYLSSKIITHPGHPSQDAPFDFHPELKGKEGD